MEGHTRPDAAQREGEAPGRGLTGTTWRGGGGGRDSGMRAPGPGGGGRGWTDAATWRWLPEGTGRLAGRREWRATGSE